MKAKVMTPGLEKLVRVGDAYVHSFHKEGDIIDHQDCFRLVQLGHCVPADEECEQMIAGIKAQQAEVTKKKQAANAKALKELMDASGPLKTLS